MIILSFLFVKNDVFALTYYSDDFNKNNLDNWDIVGEYNNPNGWKIIDNKLVGEVGYKGYSFLLAKSFWNLSDYSIRFDSVNENAIDQEIVFRINEDRTKFYMLNLRFLDSDWSQDGEIVLWKYQSDIGYRRISTFNKINTINLTQNEVHKVKIEANNSNIKIYFDSILIIDVDDENPILTGSFGFYNWGGDFCYGLSKNTFDNLIVGDFNYDDIPFPTPTPITVSKPKIIILPGLGASWNSEAIVYNKKIADDQWKMTPFVKNYDGLINALKENDLKEDEDFYVWNYDWRKPLNEIVSSLDNFINQKINSDEKLILIGHSLGGLTSRIWAEDHKDDLRLDKVITLGSPHLGSVGTYEIWNGGQISDLSKISSIAFKILLKIQGLNTETDVEAVRKYTPIIKDLLPTFDFVNKHGISYFNKLETKNNFLAIKNNEASDSGKVKLFSGKDYKTLNSIELGNNNLFDKFLGIWPDGRIKKNLYSNSGDGTVLTKSANYKGNNFIEINSNHGDIINKTINNVMLEIGLSQVNVINNSFDLVNNLIVFVGSPVDYSVKCDNESPVIEDDGFVFIKNKDYKACAINLIGNDNGLIHVVIGNTNDNNWSYWEKKIVKGEVNKIKINPNNGQIINEKDNVLFLKSIIKQDIDSLLLLNKNNKELKEALKNLDKNQPILLIKNIFDFRRNNYEKNISERIIDNSTTWMSLINKCSKNIADNGFRKINNYQDLINFLLNLKFKKVFKINKSAALSYQKMDEIININKIKLTQKDYSEVCANNFAALNYGNEVLVKTYDKNEYKKWLLQDSDL